MCTISILKVSHYFSSICSGSFFPNEKWSFSKKPKKHVTFISIYDRTDSNINEPICTFCLQSGFHAHGDGFTLTAFNFWTDLFKLPLHFAVNSRQNVQFTVKTYKSKWNKIKKMLDFSVYNSNLVLNFWMIWCYLFKWLNVIEKIVWRPKNDIWWKNI